MCYNLYGTHTKDAGPKADSAFIDTVLGRVDRLPRPHSIAFATGGCIWESGQSPRMVTEGEARELAKSLHAKVQREPSSQALRFEGRRADGAAVTGWYGDSETIRAWKQQALEHGVDGISLWRLGGNDHIRTYYVGLMP